MELQTLDRPQVRRQPEAVERGAIEDPLVSEVVNRENGGWWRWFPCEQCGGEAGLPIVEMNDVGTKARFDRMRCEPHDGARQQREPLRVVGPVGSVDVDVRIAASTKQGRTRDQPQPLALRSGRFDYLDVAIVQLHARDRTRVRKLLHEVSVERQDHPHVASERYQRRRQAPRNVGESASLHEWRHFTGGKKHTRAVQVFLRCTLVSGSSKRTVEVEAQIQSMRPISNGCDSSS